MAQSAARMHQNSNAMLVTDHSKRTNFFPVDNRRKKETAKSQHAACTRENLSVKVGRAARLHYSSTSRSSDEHTETRHRETHAHSSTSLLVVDGQVGKCCREHCL